MSLKMRAIDLYNLDLEQVWGLEDGDIELEFDDGILHTTTRASILSWYCGVYHRLYNIPCLIEHHIGNGIVTKQTHLRALEKGLFKVLDTVEDVDVEELMLIAFEVTNDIFNDFNERVASYVSTISILDFIDVVEHPVIKKATDEVKLTEDSINDLYGTIKTTLHDRDDKLLVRNTVARMAKSGLVSQGQIQQCVGPRGYLTDIDNNIFRTPIKSSYTRGIRTLAESMMESRSAAKSVVFNAIKISGTEYFNRELQILNSIVTRIHKGDCGSTKHQLFHVTSNNFYNILGKYHITDSGEVAEITINSKELIDTTVKLRTIINCNHTDSYGVCEYCYGYIGNSIPRNTNIGFVSSIVLGAKSSQAVFSTKHFDKSSAADIFEINDIDGGFISVELEKSDDDETFVNTIHLKSRIRNKSPLLILDSKSVPDLHLVENTEVSKLNVSAISNVPTITIEIDVGGGFTEQTTIAVSKSKRIPWLSSDFLEYVKSVKWTINNDGDYVIDLSKWDFKKSFLILPHKHSDMSLFVRSVKSAIMTSGKRIRGKTRSYESVLDELFNLINSKISINYVHVEIMVLAELTRDLEAGDHRLPIMKDTGILSTYSENVKRRSLGATMAYQGQGKALTNIQSYIYTKTPDSFYDNILAPLPNHNPSE